MAVKTTLTPNAVPHTLSLQLTQHATQLSAIHARDKRAQAMACVAVMESVRATLDIRVSAVRTAFRRKALNQREGSIAQWVSAFLAQITHG